MPAHSMTLAHLQFRTKGDALKFLEDMLRKYDVGDKVSAEDEAILTAALARHPDSTSKVGNGLTHISVRSADFGTKCFWVNRNDGTTEKFSIKKCIYV